MLSPLSRVLASLIVPGGTVKRDVFVGAFPMLVTELKAGTPLSANSFTLPNPIKPLAPSPTNRGSRPGDVNEGLLSVAEGPLGNPLRRQGHHPWFEISGLRLGNTPQESMDLDYLNAGKMRGTIAIIVKTNGKTFRILVDSETLNTMRCGTLHCDFERLEASLVPDSSSPFSRISQLDTSIYKPNVTSGPSLGSRHGPDAKFGAITEAYLELTEGSDSDFFSFKVSNSAIAGKVEAATFARELRPEEVRAYNAWLNKTEQPPPAGTSFVRTTTLVPGTPILARRGSEWIAAEILSVSDERVATVHWPSLGHSFNQVLERSLIAASDETLQRLKSRPGSFKPSVELPIGALQPPPNGFIALRDEVKLFPGTPLKSLAEEGSSSWTNFTVITTTDDDRVLVYWNQPLGRIDSRQRKQFAISTTVVTELQAAGAEQKFGERLKAIQVAIEKLKSRFSALQKSMLAARPHHYFISIPLPSTSVRVDDDTPLAVGTRCALELARQWIPVTVTYLHANGNVDVNFDGRWGAEPVTRDSLIIQSARLTKLQANSKKSQPTSKSASSGNQSPSSSGGGEKFKLVLENSGANKITVSKVVMEITGLDLADAKEILDNTPIDLKGGLTKADAEKWQKKLQEAGASAKIKAVKTEGDKSPAERLN